MGLILVKIRRVVLTMLFVANAFSLNAAAYFLQDFNSASGNLNIVGQSGLITYGQDLGNNRTGATYVRSVATSHWGDKIAFTKSAVSGSGAYLTLKAPVANLKYAIEFVNVVNGVETRQSLLVGQTSNEGWVSTAFSPFTGSNININHNWDKMYLYIDPMNEKDWSGLSASQRTFGFDYLVTYDTEGYSINTTVSYVDFNTIRFDVADYIPFFNTYFTGELISTYSVDKYEIDYTENGSVDLTISNGGAVSFQQDYPCSNNLANAAIYVYVNMGAYGTRKFLTRGYFTITAPTPEIVANAEELCLSSTGASMSVSNGNPVAGVSYEWTDPWNQKNPSFGIGHVIYTAGKYVYTLTATTVCGSVSATKEINVISVPNVEFSAQGTCQGSTLSFVNTSSGDGDYIWNFGDNQTSSSESPSHTYSAFGNYNVSLTSTNQCGTDNITKSVSVGTIAIPNIISSEDVICKKVGGTAVTLYNLNFVDGVNYTWTLPDNTTSVSPTLSQNFSEVGVYEYSIVGAMVGCPSVSATKQIKVISQPQVAFSATDLCQGNTVEFVNGSGGGGDYTWSFGDTKTSTSLSPVHYYSSLGTYNVTLTSANKCGTDSETKTIKVGEKFQADFTMSSNTVCKGTNINFSSTPSGSGYTYLWNFGDGETDDDASVTRDYDNVGTYDVSLTISRGGSCVSTVKKKVFVKGNITVTASAEKNLLCEGESTLLKGKIGNYTTSETYQYKWKNGSGTEVGEAINLTVSAAGTYTLYVKGACNNWESSNAVVITSQLAINASVNVTGANCTSRGSATLTFGSGQVASQYGIKWEATGATTQSVTNLPKGVSYVVLTHSTSGCKKTLPVNVPDYGLSVNTITIDPAPCHGLYPGKINVSVNGATGNLSYQWFNSNGVSVTNNAELLGGVDNYKVKITDQSSGCVLIKENLYIGHPAVFVSANNVVSCGPSPKDSKVKIGTTLTTGQLAGKTFTYEWFKLNTGGVEIQPAVATVNTSELEATAELTQFGSYKVRVTADDYGCSGEAAMTFTEGAPLSLSTSFDEGSCLRSPKLSAVVSGGKAPFSFDWTKGSTSLGHSATIATPEDGSYTVEVEDANGCTSSYEKVVEIDNNLPVVTDAGPVSEELPCQATATVSGGTTPYLYRWKRVVTKFDINGDHVIDANDKVYKDEESSSSHTVITLQGGTYVVEVTDAKGCKSDLSQEFEIKSRAEDKTFTLHFRFKKVTEVSDPNTVVDVPNPEAETFVSSVKTTLYQSLDECKATLANISKNDVVKSCYNPEGMKDEFSVKKTANYHHYMLYYYDRAGRLVKTVAPEGVKVFNYDLSVGGGDADKTKLLQKDPSINMQHEFQTRYKYNSLGQLVWQRSPDGNETNFWYTEAGLLRFSQNAQQKIDEEYSYITYDQLSRPTESGVVSGISESDITTNMSNWSYPSALSTRSKIIRTVYDEAAVVDYFGKSQRFLLNNVSYVYTDEDSHENTLNDRMTTYYSYDPHGNVEWIVQDLPGFTKNYVAYDYDLISGNVLQVKYNEMRPDKFFHRYSYDKENRVVSVETSRDRYLWDKDASYDYEIHGALRRTKIGEDKIQGGDYTYTAHGWLKGINSPDLLSNNDPGKDGLLASVNENFLPDQMGLSLGYYKGDYIKMGSVFDSRNTTTNYHSYGIGNLYNGNISNWTYRQAENIAMTSDPYQGKMIGKAYRYDELNRIKNSDFYTTDPNAISWQADNTGRYATRNTYDANGNILTNVVKHNASNNNGMDNLNYHYAQVVGKKDINDNDYDVKTNKLEWVEDAEIFNPSNDKKDIHGKHSYRYDHIGNLIEEIEDDATVNHKIKTLITWNIAGKVVQVDKIEINRSTNAETFKLRMKFHYDAMGNRVIKDVVKNENDPTENYKLFYLKDASGNTLAVYERKVVAGSTPGSYLVRFRVKEMDIYGSDRIGMLSPMEISNDYLLKEVAVSSISDIENITFDINGVKVNSALYHWIAPRSSSDKVDNKDIVDTKIEQLDNITPQTEGVISSFIGKVDNNIGIVENKSGEIQFYHLAPENYLGNQSVTLLLDKNHNLMKGAEGIKASAKSKSLVVKVQGEQSKYLLFNVDDNGVAYYNLIDLSEEGFGTASAPMGEVVEKNVPLAGANNIGYHMTAMEDGMTGRNLLYLTRYNAPVVQAELGKKEVLVYEFKTGEKGSPSPTLMAEIAGMDEKGEGEIQLSKDGKYLLVYNKKKKLGGFEHKEMEITLLGLQASRTEVVPGSVVTMISSGGNYGKGSLDFTDAGNVVFNQQSTINRTNDEGSDLQLWYYNKNGQYIDAANTMIKGDARRSINTKVYLPGLNKAIAADPDKMAELTVSTTDVQESNLDLLALTDYVLTGALPMQVLKLEKAFEENVMKNRITGEKQYELKDHLGNVRVVVSDARLVTIASNTITGKTADVLSITDYYPFGMEMPGRNYSGEKYRYGFQAQETDEEWLDGAIAFNYRVHDARIGRFLSVDPLAKQYPHNSVYAFSENRVTNAVEIEGLEAEDQAQTTGGKTETTGSTNVNAFLNVGTETNRIGFDINAKYNLWSSGNNSVSFYNRLLVTGNLSQNSIFGLGGNVVGSTTLSYNYKQFSLAYSIEPRINVGNLSRQSNISSTIHVFWKMSSNLNGQFSFNNDVLTPGFGYNAEFKNFNKTDGGLTQAMTLGVWSNNYKYGALISAFGYTPHRKMENEVYLQQPGTKGYYSDNGIVDVPRYDGEYRTYMGLTLAYNDRKLGQKITISAGLQSDLRRQMLQGVIHEYVVESPELNGSYDKEYAYLQISLTRTIFPSKQMKGERRRHKNSPYH
ncbi:MAG: PKD domain-containing protein [Flavobacteriales bacterium]